MGLHVIVLGAAAGGGAPQWNCRSSTSRKLRHRQLWRTQSSIAISADQQSWFLCNASPDIAWQMRQNPALHPQEGVRHSPIKGVVLTNGDVDHVAGLLTLRESQPLALYATQRVGNVLQQNSIFQVLNPEFVDRRDLVLDKEIALSGKDCQETGVVIKPFGVPGKVALWLEDESQGDNFGTVEEDTIALEISDGEGRCFFYIPACAAITDNLRRRIRGASLVFFDGTVFRDDEMVATGAGVKTGMRMGHMCNAGDNGAIAALAPLDIERKIFIHINTTNPILLDDSDERRYVEKAGWEVAFDGMEVHL